MTTETAKTTEQEQGEWIVAVHSPGGVWSGILKSRACLLVKAKSKTREDIKAAMRDPDRVLNVSAFSEVVDACDMLLQIIEHANVGAFTNGNTAPGGTIDEGEAMTFEAVERCRAKLASVHPAAEGAET